MEYETGKWLERIEYKIDLLLAKHYPEKEEKKEINPEGDKPSGKTSNPDIIPQEGKKWIQ